MRKPLKALVILSVLTAGCGNSDPNIVSDAANSARPTPTVIPVSGGQIALPSQAGFSGSIEFEPGSESGNEILLSTSTSPPAGATLPFVGLDHESAQTRPFLYVTMSVSRPTPLSILEAFHLQGPIPSEHEQHHADLFELPSSGDGVLASQHEAVHLQEFPGEPHSQGASYSEIAHDTLLYPGKTYLVGFKSTDHKTMAFDIVNESGVWPCYVFITGRHPVKRGEDPRFYRLTADGKFVAMDYDNDISDPTKDRYADYNIEVPRDGKLTINLPLMSAGRAYISLGEKHKTEIFRPDPNSPNPGTTMWGTPNGWSNPNDPNFRSLWDWVEFDYTITPDSGKAGMGINKTEVQMKSLPFTITMDVPVDGTGALKSMTTGSKAETRKLLFGQLAEHPDFASLVVQGTATGTDVSPIRVIAPDNGIQNAQLKVPGAPTFDENYFSDYIDAVWDKYRSEDLTMVTSAFGTFVGRVNDNDELVFTSPGALDVVVAKPASIDVIVGTGALTHGRIAAPKDDLERRHNIIVNEVASTMSAYFNRSMLLKETTMYRTFTPRTGETLAEAIERLTSQFYQHPITNFYSKLIHEHSLVTTRAPYGAAYGFGFDDNLEQSSFIANNQDPKEVTITIKKF